MPAILARSCSPRWGHSEDGLFSFLQGKLKDWQTNLTIYKTLADTGKRLVHCEVGLPVLELALQEEKQAVLTMSTPLGEQLLAEVAGILDGLWIGGPAFQDDDHLAAFCRCGDRLERFAGREQCTIHHQVYVAQHDEACQKQENLVFGPAVGPQGIPFFDEVVQDNLAVDPGTQIDVV